jgi:hypothetical protein
MLSMGFILYALPFKTEMMKIIVFVLLMLNVALLIHSAVIGAEYIYNYSSWEMLGVVGYSFGCVTSSYPVVSTTNSTFTTFGGTKSTLICTHVLLLFFLQAIAFKYTILTVQTGTLLWWRRRQGAEGAWERGEFNDQMTDKEKERM